MSFTIIGDNDPNVINAGGGNDSVNGAGGNDTLRGGGDNDSLEGGTGNDLLIGGNGLDTLMGDEGDDVLQGGAGDDDLSGGAGNDQVFGGGGNDVVRVALGEGSDLLDGGSGTDTLDIQGWIGPNTSTDNIAAGTYGSWTVTGPTGLDALRTFTHTDGTSFFARDFEGITCFAEGTLIATARGEVPVETLRVGDLVLTAHGGAPLKPLIWVGHTTVDVARQRNKAAVAPIVIKAGALADGVPRRELRVSPEHALFLDGRLVQAKLLVNGSTIVQESWAGRITYWHIELESHGLVVSEGAVTESYLDDGNRHLFDNAGLTMIAVDFAAHRSNGRYASAACAPLMREGEVALANLRTRLEQRVPAQRASA
jgi:hypothetical protein